VLRDALESSGVLQRLRAELQAELLSAVRGEPSALQLPRPPADIALLNALIGEYLEATGYRHTLSTLRVESGQPERLPRELLAEELGVEDAPSDTPLLLHIIAGAREAARMVRRDGRGPTGLPPR
jgi:hypothetical protein